jgi:hypothetical protein
VEFQPGRCRRTLADDLRQNGGKISPCVRTYKSAGANDIVLLKCCTCMYRKPIMTWNLRKDDLAEQSDECVKFLAQLLS